MGHGPRRSNRRLLLGGLAAITLAAGTAIPAVAAFGVGDYPVPPPPTVEPTNVTRPPTNPTDPPVVVEGTTVSNTNTNTKKANNGVEVLGAQVTRGSMPFTGGDVAGLAAIGAGAVAVGAIMVRRSRRSGAKA